jgi:4-hydroxy-tetrahydrodipicolinate synthase
VNEMCDGVWPVMLTPFKGRDQIDWEGLEELTKWYIRQGVHGLFSACLSSEALDMSNANKLALIKRVVEIADGGVPVIAGVMGVETRQERMEMAQQVVSDGAVAAVLTLCDIVPEGTADEEWIDEMERHVALSSGVPMGVYECPWPYKRMLTPALTDYVTRQPQFLFLKETSCDLAEIERKSAAGKQSGLKVFSADATSILKAYELGVNGYSGLQTNLWPALHAELFGCHQSDSERAGRLQQFFIDYNWVLSRSYPASAKLFLSMAHGLNIDPLSFLNDASADASDQEWLEDLADAVKKISEEELCEEVCV